MKIAIFSDIHGNNEALEAILNDIKKQDIDEIICLGDVIAIGPNPRECMDLIVDNNIKMVWGNHELYYLRGTQINANMEESELRHQEWVKSQLTSKHFEYLNNCSLYIEKEYNDKKILFEHFPFDESMNLKYPFYDLSIAKDGRIKEIAQSYNYDLIFIGHEHNSFNIDNKLYDVGSSGCTKNNITRYTVLDIDDFSILIKELEYDRDAFVRSLISTDYPTKQFLAKWAFGVEI